MAQEIVLGEIQDVREDGSVVITATLPNLDTALIRRYKTVQIGFCDGRRISPEQRAKAYALIGEIADWIGDYKASVKETMKWEFMLNRMDKMRKAMFSLSDVDMNTASEFITFLIDFILEHGIPTRIPLSDMAEDLKRYAWSALMHKRCIICGKPAELHHLEGSRIGMGSDRHEVPHIGRMAIPLCREHHTIIHTVSEWKFLHDNHIVGVEIDEHIAKKYRLKGKIEQSKTVDTRS